MTNVIYLEEALRHLEDRIPDAENCKKIITELVRWVIDWNQDRSQNNQVFCFLREFQGQNRKERVNVAFALDRDDNRLRNSKPNFMVIKLRNTDREFKGIHADFDFTGSGLSQPPNDLQTYLKLRPSRAQSNRRRWIAECGDIYSMNFDNFLRLFLTAYQRRGGMA